MKQQSANYNPFTSVRNIDVGISFELVDTNAKGNATPSASAASISNNAQMIDGNSYVSGKYATLEKDYWALDGTFEIIPDDTATIETGWWGATLSDESGAFSTYPYVMFSLSAPASSIGFTLHFDGRSAQYPTKTIVTTYGSNGATVISQNTFEKTGAIQTYSLESENYYFVKFEFIKTSNVYRRVRVCEVDFGIVQNFDKDSLVKANFIYGASLTAESATAKQLNFTFDNSDKKYNLLNPSGLYAYLQDGQNISAKIYVNGEPVDMGVFKFTSAVARDGALTAEIIANDGLYALDKQLFTGSNTTKTMSEAISTILSGTGITANVDSTYGQLTVVMAIPDGTTKREAVRLVAQAATCTAWVDRSGVLQVGRISASETADGKITADELYDYNGVSVSEAVDKVVLSVNNSFSGENAQYTSGTGANEKSVTNPCVYSGSAQTVADYLLSCYNKRKKYSVKNRCDPSVEVGDTLKISDAYAQNENAVITDINILFGGGLYAVTSAVGR